MQLISPMDNKTRFEFMAFVVPFFLRSFKSIKDFVSIEMDGLHSANCYDELVQMFRCQSSMKKNLGPAKRHTKWQAIGIKSSN
jgi:hypothetical protein